MESATNITVTRNEIAGSARIEINLPSLSGPLAYSVARQMDAERYVVRDPFGAAIDGVPTFERAIDIARGLAENVCEWAGGSLDC